MHVTCGNIATRDLIALFDLYRREFDSAVDAYAFIEIDRPGVIVHDSS